MVEIQTVYVNQLKENQQETVKEKHGVRHKMAIKFAGEITKQREEVESLRSVLASINSKLIQAPATPSCRMRSRVEESDLEIKVGIPPRRNNKSQQEKREEKKKKH